MKALLPFLLVTLIGCVAEEDNDLSFAAGTNTVEWLRTFMGPGQYDGGGQGACLLTVGFTAGNNAFIHVQGDKLGFTGLSLVGEEDCRLTVNGGTCKDMVGAVSYFRLARDDYPGSFYIEMHEADVTGDLQQINYCGAAVRL